MAIHRLLGVASFVACSAISVGAWAQDVVAPPVPTTAPGAAPPPAGTPPGAPVPAPVPATPATPPTTTPVPAAAPAKDDPPDAGADIKSGKLIRYGLTAGVAFSVHVPFRPSLQKYVGVSGMPYLAILPGWWWRKMGNITRAYCADKFLFDSNEHAKKAADAMAEGIAQPRFQAANPGKAFPAKGGTDYVATVKQYSGWDASSDQVGACSFWQTVGFYGGYPTTFNVDGRAIHSDGVKARDYK